MGSPIDTWEGATVIFTGAGSGLSIGLFLLIAVALTVLPLFDSAKHENAAYEKDGA